jgi:hypothetical protein
MSEAYSDHTARDEDESSDDGAERESTNTTDSVTARTSVGHTGTDSDEYPRDDTDDVGWIGIVDMVSRYDVAIECNTVREPDVEIVSPVFFFGVFPELSLDDA